LRDISKEKCTDYNTDQCKIMSPTFQIGKDTARLACLLKKGHDNTHIHPNAFEFYWEWNDKEIIVQERLS
jgi:hypothetical protein